jgi:hypothetical protein
MLQMAECLSMSRKLLNKGPSNSLLSIRREAGKWHGPFIADPTLFLLKLTERKTNCSFGRRRRRMHPNVAPWQIENSQGQDCSKFECRGKSQCFRF